MPCTNVLFKNIYIYMNYIITVLFCEKKIIMIFLHAINISKYLHINNCPWHLKDDCLVFNVT